MIPIILASMLGFMSKLFFDQREENKRKDNVILAYEEDERTYFVDSVGWVTEKRTYERTVRELRKSKDSVLMNSLSIAHELGIKEKNITSLTSSVARLEQAFKVKTDVLTYSEMSEVLYLTDSINLSDLVEVEEFSDPWMNMKRIKVIGSDSAAYSYSMELPLTEFSHKKKTKYLDRTFFITRAVVKLFEKKQEFKTIVSNNPSVVITDVTHTVVVD